MILVLDMQDRRPVWAMPEWVPERIRAALLEGDPSPSAEDDAVTAGSELRVTHVPTNGSGDGAARVHPAVLDAVADADAYLGYGIAPEILRRGRRLRWVHSGAAGVGGSLTPEMMASDVVFTNSAGVHAPPMAETVVGMILHFFRGLDRAVRGQAERRWVAERFYRAEDPPRELSRATVGIVGFGGVGREVARRCAALGAEVLALRRTEAGPDEVGLTTVGAESPIGVAAVLVRGEDAAGRLAERSDVIVVSAPETPETRGMIDRTFLERVKPGALLVNVGRGGLVVEEDLLEALGRGRLGGAALDVFRSEPLPEGHPFWERHDVLLTPHVSAVTDAFWERETALIVENLVRLREGRPLLNVVDRQAGY